MQQLKYIKQFDGLRAIAVSLVIIAHWFPVSFVTSVGFGSIGVEIFFVLSGFLITRILISSRTSYDMNSNISRWIFIKNFMIRRALRIFPIYYLLLIILIFLRDYFPNSVFDYWQWYFFYAQNFLVFKLQMWPGGKLSHLWTLAVEEQVYLIWPFLFFTIKVENIKFYLISFIIIGFISSFLMPICFPNTLFTDVLTPTCIQGFAVGGLLAYFHLKGEDIFRKISFYFIYLGIFAFLYFVLTKVKLVPMLFSIRFYIDCITCGLIANILITPKSLFNTYFLGNPLLVRIGKISYGLYLFHNFIPVFWNVLLKIFDKYGITLPYTRHQSALFNQDLFFYIQCFLILFLLSYFSYIFYEKPILRLKERFANGIKLNE